MESKKVIVLYTSNTGFTKKYAHWIADSLKCEVQSLENFDSNKISGFDLVILGGWIHAGKISGIQFIKRNISSLAGKDIVIFATGAIDPSSKEVEKFRKDSIPTDIDSEFFYFQSGLNYEKIKGVDKWLMRVLKLFLRIKKNKSEDEQGALDRIQDSFDVSSEEQIEPLINYLSKEKPA